MVIDVLDSDKVVAIAITTRTAPARLPVRQQHPAHRSQENSLWQAFHADQTQSEVWFTSVSLLALTCARIRPTDASSLDIMIRIKGN